MGIRRHTVLGGSSVSCCRDELYRLFGVFGTIDKIFVVPNKDNFEITSDVAYIRFLDSKDCSQCLNRREHIQHAYNLSIMNAVPEKIPSSARSTLLY